LQIVLASNPRIRQIQKIPQLWKDVDPGLPDVEDAKKRLAGLKGN